MPNGCQVLHLTPLELLDKLAKLIPPPRKHPTAWMQELGRRRMPKPRLRYYGVLAPNAPLRKVVTTQADKTVAATAISGSKNEEMESRKKPCARYLWAALLARIYEVLPLVCPHCGSEMRLIAAITDNPSIERILIHIGEPGRPPPVTPARGPPEWEWDFDDPHGVGNADHAGSDYLPATPGPCGRLHPGSLPAIHGLRDNCRSVYNDYEFDLGHWAGHGYTYRIPVIERISW